MRSLLAVFLALSLGACTMPQRYAGHWTETKDRSYFETIDRRQRFRVSNREMPRSAERFLEAQPKVADASSADGRSASVYLELLGYPVQVEPWCYLQDLQETSTWLSVVHIRRMAPAQPAYLRSLQRPRTSGSSRPPED